MGDPPTAPEMARPADVAQQEASMNVACEEEAGRVAWLKRLRGRRHWALDDIEQLVLEADAAGAPVREYALGLGLRRTRVERWLARWNARGDVGGSLDTNDGFSANAFVELRGSLSSTSPCIAPPRTTAANRATVIVRVGAAEVLVSADREGARFVAQMLMELEHGTGSSCS